jgi:hypothetical protein
MSFDGGSRILLASVAAPAPAIDPNQVYWWNSATGYVNVATFDGGYPPVQPVASGFNSPSVTTGITIDTNNVYFTVGGTADGGFANGEVIQVPRVGGTPYTLASGLTSPGAIALGGGSVFWSDSRGVLSVPVDGGNTVTVASDTSNATNVLVDGTNVYWSDNSSIRRAALDGGSPVTLVPSTFVFGVLDALAVDSTSIYWTGGGSGSVKKVTPK